MRPVLVLTHSWSVIIWGFSAAGRVVPLVAVLNTKDGHLVENLKTGDSLQPAGLSLWWQFLILRIDKKSQN